MPKPTGSGPKGKVTSKDSLTHRRKVKGVEDEKQLGEWVEQFLPEVEKEEARISRARKRVVDNLRALQAAELRTTRTRRSTKKVDYTYDSLDDVSVLDFLGSQADPAGRRRYASARRAERHCGRRLRTTTPACHPRRAPIWTAAGARGGGGRVVRRRNAERECQSTHVVCALVTTTSRRRSVPRRNEEGEGICVDRGRFVSSAAEWQRIDAGERGRRSCRRGTNGHRRRRVVSMHCAVSVPWSGLQPMSSLHAANLSRTL